MKTASIRELRNDFGRLSKWLAQGETVEILKRGQPMANFMPQPKTMVFRGAGQGTMRIMPDFDEPLNLECEAMT